MLIRIHLTPEEGERYELSEAFRSYINNQAHIIRMRSDMNVEVFCSVFQKLYAVFAPIDLRRASQTEVERRTKALEALAGNDSRERETSIPPPMPARKPTSDTLVSMRAIPPPSSIPREYQAKEPQPLQVHEKTKSSRPVYSSETVEIGRIKLKKRSHNREGDE